MRGSIAGDQGVQAVVQAEHRQRFGRGAGHGGQMQRRATFGHAAPGGQQQLQPGTVDVGHAAQVQRQVASGGAQGIDQGVAAGCGVRDREVRAQGQRGSGGKGVSVHQAHSRLTASTKTPGLQGLVR
jgi:hypothetical protein